MRFDGAINWLKDRLKGLDAPLTPRPAPALLEIHPEYISSGLM